MAIAFDAVANGKANSVTSLTFAHTCASGTGVLLIVSVNVETTSDVVSGVTYAGVAMTRHEKTSGTDANKGAWSQYIYYLYAPTSGANNVVVSVGGTNSIGAMSVSYTGAAQTGFPDSSNHSATSGTPVTASTTVVGSNCWTILFPYVSNNSLGTSTGSTSRQTVGVGYAGWFQIGTFDSNGTVSAGSHNMAYTANTGTSSMWYMLSIGEYVAPPNNGNMLMFM